MGELRHCELGFAEPPAGRLIAAQGRVLAEMDAAEAVATAVDEGVDAGFPAFTHFARGTWGRLGP